MKRCPTCQSTYTDDSLRFCLQDGSPLVSMGDDPPPTEIMDVRHAPTARASAPAPTEIIHSRATQSGPPPSAVHAPSPSSPAIKALLITLIALVLISAFLGIVLWQRSSSPSTSTENNRNIVASEGNRSVAGDANRNDAPAKGEQVGAAASNIKATASSTRPALAGNTYVPGNVLDGRLMTAWTEGVDGAGVGEWIRCDFGREVTLQRISIAPGYFKSPQIWARNNRVAAATFYFSDGTTREFRFSDRMVEQMVEVGAVRTSWVRVVINEVYDGTDPDTAISQLAFEWEQ